MKNKPKIDCVDLEPRTNETAPSVAVESVSAENRQGLFEERPLPVIEIAPRVLRYRTRRDFLLFGAGAIATLAGSGFLLPQDTLRRMGVRRTVDSPAKEWFLNRALRIDDDVAEALYSGNRRVPTYTKSQITPLKNNYNGATLDSAYISGWNLTLDGLASGLSIPLDLRILNTRFSIQEQITRLVCVEGWSAIAWWAGLRFDDLLRAYPPKSQAKWARVESSVNLDASGNPDPYCGSWSAAPSVGARETRFKECEGHYQDYVCRGRAKRLLGRTWIFPLRRNLTPLHTEPQSTDASIAKQYSSRILIVPACKRRSSP